MSNIPRNEYPRPQMQRKDWLCLNGSWEFEVDQGDSGLHRGLLTRSLAQTIQVPFCPESKLSGIENKDHLICVWYRKRVKVPTEWQADQILIHFQAVDYESTVWVNGEEVARHRGGFTPFSCKVDLSNLTVDREIEIVLRARDYDDLPQPRGKQARGFAGHGALYGRTTGIWQTVWMEPVPQIHLQRPRLTPVGSTESLKVVQPLSVSTEGHQILFQILADGKEVASKALKTNADFTLQADIPLTTVRRWTIEDPFLYEVNVELQNTVGEVVDSYQSYFGFRTVSLDGKKFKLNGKTIFQRLVLDQGYYPNGLMTAPRDEDLVEDIRLSLEAGFNGARLHQKVFEERFLYHADRMGYLVWGEFGDWGAANLGRFPHHQSFSASYITEWLEAIERDYSHPSIVGWCPLNETWEPIMEEMSQLDDITRGMFLATKAMDPTRPVLDTSGYSHRIHETDVYDCHDYTQDPEKFAEHHSHVGEGNPYQNEWKVEGPHLRDYRGRPLKQRWSTPYRGQPYFVSEFGGIWWNPEDEHRDSWGYGERPKNIEEFYDRFEKLCTILLQNPLMFGYCYTQLTDIDQEQNGIYTYRRDIKFDMQRIRRVQTQIAAIEKLDD
jgi:beta-galactosidase/beta-glucuronidase